MRAWGLPQWQSTCLTCLRAPRFNPQHLRKKKKKNNNEKENQKWVIIHFPWPISSKFWSLHDFDCYRSYLLWPSFLFKVLSVLVKINCNAGLKPATLESCILFLTSGGPRRNGWQAFSKVHLVRFWGAHSSGKDQGRTTLLLAGLSG